ncbi:Phox/Bem1p [Artemisia annua]|uniref:Phox/Bem1p n=1 Tax=Artemisia annua TaxID=35608 RepID=A0A2U1PKU8_ARTAN|nr:Phox/Bem1p [Artemisia annua]
MDPPPMSTTTATTVVYNQNYQDSIESSSVSSPTSRQWDDTLPPPKLRMMCSYGGHIIPRPHDKSLCYMGGETRIVVADRHTSLADLCSRLSTTLLHGRHFSLKYQLPSEDLDSLVSVTTDEDLDNMIEEYDRLNASNPSAKPLRLRLFLFLSKPDTAASVGSLLDDAKSETWFVDALNGAGLLPRGLSDSANIDNLLEHKDGTVSEDRDNSMELETQRRRLDVHLNLPDSPLVETNSSFGSSSSSPSMSNLPPIKVRVDQHMNQMAGLDEQLGQLNVNTSSAQQSVAVNNVVGGGVWGGEEERLEHAGATSGGLRKPPLPLQPVQRKFGHDAYSLPSPESKHGGAYGLHSPDSIARYLSKLIY